MAACTVRFGRQLFIQVLSSYFPRKGIVITKETGFPVCQFVRFQSQWHLVGAVCLERKPVVSQELAPLEQEYKLYSDKEELNLSLLSDHELRHIKDQKRASRKKQADTQDLEESFKNTAQDDENVYTKELQEFRPAPRISEADENQDTKSLSRHLDKHLILLVKQKLGNVSHWGLPQAVRQDGQTLRQVAECVCKDICGENMKTTFLGNAPVGYYKYKYPKEARKDEIIGAKIFFFKAWHHEGDICANTFKNNKEAEDYMWATRSEIASCVTQKEYHKTISNFLVEEECPGSDAVEFKEDLANLYQNELERVSN